MVSSVLEELEGLLAPVKFPPASAFAGSLDYIDSLPTGSPLVVNAPILAGLALGRNAAAISNVRQPLPPMPGSDNRRFNFDAVYNPGEIQPLAGRVREFDPNYDLPPEEVERRLQEHLRRATRSIWQPKTNPRPSGSRLGFSDAWRVILCLKRKMRREIMHALGYSGRFYRPHHFTPYSKVSCFDGLF